MPLKIFGLDLSKGGDLEASGTEGLNLYNDFTVSFKVMLWQSNESGLRDLVNKTDGTNWAKATFRIGYTDFGSYGLLRYVHGDGTNLQQITLSPINKLEPTHIVIKVEDGYVTCWKNGDVDTLGQFTFDTYYESVNPIRIGWCSGASVANTAHGCISDVQIFDRPLTTDEIKALFENPNNPPTDGLVIWYPLNDHCIINRANPKQYPGVLHNLQFAKKISDGAMFEWNPQSYISCPYIDLTKDFTMYVEFVPMSSMGNFGRLICVGYNERAINLEAQFGANRCCTLEMIDANQNHALAEASIPWVQNTTNTVCVIKEGNTVKMYINGKYDEDITVKYNGVVTTNDVFDLDMSYYTSGTRIGRALYLQEQYYGAMRDVKIWDVALTEDEVFENLCNPQNPPRYDNLQLWLPLRDKMGIYARDYSKNKYTCTLTGVRWLA